MLGETQVQIYRSEGLADDRELLGVAIYAHLRALPGLMANSDLQHLPQTIRGLGIIFNNRVRYDGYRNAWIGKAFEYAVAQIHSHQIDPHYSLLMEGLELAFDGKRTLRATRVSVDLNALQCVRVCKESADAEDLAVEFGKLRLLNDARRTIEGSLAVTPSIAQKVDVLFCERDSFENPRFGILASLKVNPGDLQNSSFRHETRKHPIDLVVTTANRFVPTPYFDQEIDAAVVPLPMRPAEGIYAWEQATKILLAALETGNRSSFLRILAAWIKPGTPEKWWVDFVASRLETDLMLLCEEIESHVRTDQSTIWLPTMGGTECDSTIQLGM